LKVFNLTNSKGISVLFLVIAMLLMVTIGYVFSYLIPMKQKAVELPINSTKAFFFAQAGVEYAIRYCSDQGWRRATDPAGAANRIDISRLNNAGNNQRTFGDGGFTIYYQNTTGTYRSATDILTVTGVITNSSERRIVRVTDFSSFLRLVFITTGAYNNPYWSTGTSRARFYIQNVRTTNVTLNSFSARWDEPGTHYLQRIYFNVGGAFPGTLKYLNPTLTTYANNSGAANFNRPIGGPYSYTLNAGTVYGIEIRWSGNLGGAAANNFITFYTGTGGAGDAYTFNLDSAGDTI
jgi:hypothetical protein